MKWYAEMTFRQKYIGDRAFYRMLFVLVLPLIVQQGVTNFVSLLDNLMVGKLGTGQMSSVSIVNQLIFVFNLAIFGGISGASIFGAQFAGVGDDDGVRDTFRFKMLFGTAAVLIAIGVLLAFGDELTLLFLDNEANRDLDLSVLLGYAREYLRIMLLGLLPYMIVQVYTSTLRELGETVVPMTASIIAICVNTALNLLLIFGLCGFPRLEIRGAAIATVISRYVELAVVMLYTHGKKHKFAFARGAYRSLHVPASLVRQILTVGTPLMLNEVLWSLAMTFINRCYSTRGLFAVAAVNINSTAWNLFSVIMFAMGTAVSIIVGRELGRGNREEAIAVDRKLLFVTVISHVAIGGLLAASSGLIPLLYNTEPEVRTIASKLLLLAGFSLPMHSLVHAIYFTVRSGGKTVVTFLFDSVYSWAIPAMLAFVLCTFTNLSVVAVYFAVQYSEVVKMIIGLLMLKSGFWANTVISEKKNDA